MRLCEFWIVAFVGFRSLRSFDARFSVQFVVQLLLRFGYQRRIVVSASQRRLRQRILVHASERAFFVRLLQQIFFFAFDLIAGFFFNVSSARERPPGFRRGLSRTTRGSQRRLGRTPAQRSRLELDEDHHRTNVQGRTRCPRHYLIGLKTCV